MSKSNKCVLRNGYSVEAVGNDVICSKWMLDRYVPYRTWALDAPVSKVSIYKEDEGIVKVVLENGLCGFVCAPSSIFSQLFSPLQLKSDNWKNIEPYFVQYLSNGGFLDRMIFQVPNNLREPLRNFVQSGSFGASTDVKKDCVVFMKELRAMLDELIARAD